MPTEKSYERQLTQLNREIEQLEAESARLASERVAVAKYVRRATQRFRYLKFLRKLRAPASRFELWRMAVMFLGPLVVGVVVLILVNLVTGSFPVAFFAFLLGIVAGVGLFATMMYQPPDSLLPAAIAEAEAQSRLANARLEEKVFRVAETKETLERLVEERRYHAGRIRSVRIAAAGRS